MQSRCYRIVIVGGGAGGLELAVRLARDGQKGVLLIDSSTTHVWKPRLHEMAAGVRRGQLGAIDYAGLAAQRGFAFERGTLADVDPDANTITLAALDGAYDQTAVAQRRIGYEALVLALGGVTPDMGIDGVLDHAILLDRKQDAEALFRRFSTGLLARTVAGDDNPYEIVIVGSGQTGVELGAHLATDAACADLGPASALPAIHITILEAVDTFMAQVEDKVREAVHRRLKDAGVDIRTGQQVSRITADAVETDGGESFAADLAIWTTGRVGPPLGDDIEALATNKKRQWQVRPTLQTADYDAIFALGDCAYVSDNPAPPTAQAASEQAEHLAAELPRYLAGDTPVDFQFKDKGTLLSLGDAGSLGRVRGVFSDDLQIHGRLAGAAYRGLQRQHQFLLVGPGRGIAGMLGDLFGAGGPQLKVY